MGVHSSEGSGANAHLAISMHVNGVVSGFGSETAAGFMRVSARSILEARSIHGAHG